LQNLIFGTHKGALKPHFIGTITTIIMITAVIVTIV
jgi:hypothetical protein